MATYAIGDLQGCYKSLKELLEKIKFNFNNDKLWLTGDLVNRGPNSLETLDFLLNEIPNENLITVLGNHDLYLITLYYKIFDPKDFDQTLDAILCDSNVSLYINWFKSKPLLHYDKNTNYALVHAGIDPKWDIAQALEHANEVESVLKAKEEEFTISFLRNMYGNLPNVWDNDLHGYDRLRYITNVFTRMRFLHSDGTLNFSNKYKITKSSSESENEINLIPWFEFPNRNTHNIKIIFGHWAALNGVNKKNIYGIDTGCIWGNKLTAMCLESNKLFNVSCK